jgi:hypothetical protein
MKNPHAVALGRLGGSKGGPARARVLSPIRRTEIARMAAWTRWHFLDRLRSDRSYRQKVATRIARKSGVDPGDVEHSLFSLTLDPNQRLTRCLACRD